MSRKLSYSRTKSGCICWQQLTAESAFDTVSTSHCWLCRKDCNSARLGEIKSTSKMAGFIASLATGPQLEADTPLLSRHHKFLVDWSCLRSPIPVFGGPPPPLPGDEKEYAG